MRGSGHTLVELMLVTAILAILATAAVPSYRRASEQTRVDAAAAALRSVWSAQRVHWLESRAYAASLDDLRDEGTLDAGAYTNWDSFAFDMTASDTTFTATATRGGGAWSGSISIDESGRVEGSTANSGGDRVEPGAR